MTNARKNFSLSSPSVELDPRVNAIRPDLADVALAAKLFAPHYARPVERACILVSTPMYDKPNGDLSSEILGGERFWMLDQSGGWAWGWSGHDHYVGYVASASIGPVESHLATWVNEDPIETAKQFLGMPYVWGGRGGYSCRCRSCDWGRGCCGGRRAKNRVLDRTENTHGDTPLMYVRQTNRR